MWIDFLEHFSLVPDSDRRLCGILGCSLRFWGFVYRMSWDGLYGASQWRKQMMSAPYVRCSSWIETQPYFFVLFLLKLTLPVPNRSLARFHLPSPRSSNSCFWFMPHLCPTLSITHSSSRLLLLLPVTLSFSISSISIHLLLLSLCSFSQGCLGKNGYWLLLLFPLIPALLLFFPLSLSFSLPHHNVLQQYMLLLGSDVKSGRNAACKGKKGDDTISFIVL